ncbi:MAG: hypothetical protein QXY50_02895 [Candidatus Caldarchaeum sp.]
MPPRDLVLRAALSTAAASTITFTAYLLHAFYNIVFHSLYFRPEPPALPYLAAGIALFILFYAITGIRRNTT